MAEYPRIEAIDVADLDCWLSNPTAPLADLLAQFPFLRSEAEARAFLDDIRAGLADVDAGRVVPHAQVVRDMEERRFRHRPSAAE